ncbi:prolactin receptor [Liparis tanakae]|uniref:Prolactin receptor n=1 Tax=Liparis tanakae TaxID=230148 RepID=A0A4Z2I8J7_9TELE|nr:prolactin receptor [Liparis tanakae]
MLWLLLWLLPLGGASRMALQDGAHTDGRGPEEEEVAVTTRPHIHRCRSPNMEDFSCWWLPLDNLTEGERVTYVLSYSKDKGPRRECPDYGSSGPFSCHFDSSHTSIWKIYCLSVTAVTAAANYSSPELCLDVAEIVQTEAPVNLTYELAAAGGDETGHRARLSWSYPVPSDLQYGWITLEYELQYRRGAEAGGWKVKHPLREPQVELLGLPAGDYLVRVRCRSHNYGLWSRWSSALQMSLPAGPPAGAVLVPVLVAGVAAVALLAVLLGAMPQGRSNFHSFRPPSYSEEVWDRVSAGNVFLSACGVASDPPGPRDAPMFPRDPAAVSADAPVSYVRAVAPYCCSPPPAFAAAPARSPRSGPEVVCLPGTEYSVMGHPGLPGLPGAGRSPHDFYTCVQLLNESGEVHLVPCPPPAYCREFPPPLRVEEEEEERKRKTKMADGPATISERSGGGEAAVPLLPLAVDNQG